MRILSIGNSFSQDAHAWLHQLAAGAGTDLETVNLYIGGCSLELHAANLRSGEAAYTLEINGQTQDRLVSLPKALESGPWDAVTFQQASHDSGLESTYEPYLTELVEAVRRSCPRARLLLQQTWAYETDSSHGAFHRYNFSQETMYQALTACYDRAAENHSLELIPVGRLIQALRHLEPFRYAEGGRSLCRDGFHLSWIYGRYAAACLWLRLLTGTRPAESSFIPYTPEEETDEALLDLIRETAGRI